MNILLNQINDRWYDLVTCLIFCVCATSCCGVLLEISNWRINVSQGDLKMLCFSVHKYVYRKAANNPFEFMRVTHELMLATNTIHARETQNSRTQYNGEQCLEA